MMKISQLVDKCELKERINQITINGEVYRMRQGTIPNWEIILGQLWNKEVITYYFYSQYSLYINV